MNRPPLLRLGLDELIVDNFAGGGGASTGIFAALGRSTDIAINHNAAALSMHKANHPETLHYCEDVWKVDPRKVCGGRRVGLAWFSPDCKHFSKAKGGKPVENKVRGLAWLVVRWAKAFKAGQRPRVIVLENVEEFKTWGPLLKSGLPDPAKKGLTFKIWKGKLEALGYQVEFTELRASDYDTPTIRKRLFLVARCDGNVLPWPKKMEGPARTAAECIDWNIPCPSIFDRKRPLAPATMRRIANGIKRFILDNPEPFIVGVGGRMAQSNPRPVSDAFQTITAKADSAVVTPILVGIDNKSNGGRDAWPVDDPLRTVTVENRFAVATPYLVRTAHGEQDSKGKKRGRGEHQLALALPTVTASNDFALCSPTLIQVGYGERKGQKPRVPGLHKPLGTIVNAGKHALVSAFLAKHFGGVVVGVPATTPMPTITAKGCQTQVVTSNLVKLYGTCKDGQDVREPMPTVTSSGQHIGEVRAFLTQFYGEGGGQLADLNEPMRTIRTRDCLALVTVRGEQYAIVDIGMRMLTPRELFRAQGFPEGYVIERGADGEKMTKTAQVRMCGNSVCPPLAKAVIRSQFPGHTDERLAA